MSVEADATLMDISVAGKIPDYMNKIKKRKKSKTKQNFFHCPLNTEKIETGRC
jgi:transcription initiation factor IIE alpha subunit